MEQNLDFEKPVILLENQIRELQEASRSPGIDISREISALQNKVDGLIKEIYSNLSPWERVQLSRHPLRPHTYDYIQRLFTDFHEISGDRLFSDDRSLIAGFGKLGEQKVAFVGIEKGRKTKEKIERNFGMPKPEGYRKARRLFELADRFNLPIITFVDTPGAYPGIGAEERGQAQAIAENLTMMFDVRPPIISLIIGEGGSGGALGVAVADNVLMLEYSVYSVISPESCASILWSDPKKGQEAANSLKLTPQKALDLRVIDSIVAEPPGGAHRDHEKSAKMIKEVLIEEINKFKKLGFDERKEKRFQKFRQLGNQTLKGL